MFELHPFLAYLFLFFVVAVAGLGWGFGTWLWGRLTRPRTS